MSHPDYSGLTRIELCRVLVDTNFEPPDRAAFRRAWKANYKRQSSKRTRKRTPKTTPPSCDRRCVTDSTVCGYYGTKGCPGVVVVE